MPPLPLHMFILGTRFSSKIQFQCFGAPFEKALSPILLLSVVLGTVNSSLFLLHKLQYGCLKFQSGFFFLCILRPDYSMVFFFFERDLFIITHKLSQKRNAKVLNYNNSVCCASVFAECMCNISRRS